MPFPKKSLHDLTDLEGKKVLTRVDFNVPLDEDGSVADATRLEAARPTLRHLLDGGAIPVLMSHLGRPGGEIVEGLRLNPVVEPLSDMLGCPVRKANEIVGEEARSMVSSLKPGEVGLLENLRFDPGERDCDRDFSRRLAEHGDRYVNDAFGTSHRAHASISGVPEFLRPAVAGELLLKEYEVLSRVRDAPERPFVALLGGAKISDKLPVIERFLRTADSVLIGGAMAYTFMLAEDGRVGESLVEPDFREDARRILENREDFRGELVLPVDVVITRVDGEETQTRVVPYGDIPEGWEGMDIGPETRSSFESVLRRAAMVFWNGPLGVFERDPFAEGTNHIINTLRDGEARVIVGGGDSASAINRAGATGAFEHVSTGGGASLELVRGASLPGIEALDDRE